jgi:hypothetical protein
LVVFPAQPLPRNQTQTSIAIGWVFRLAFLDKAFGLGFATEDGDAWLNGGPHMGPGSRVGVSADREALPGSEVAAHTRNHAGPLPNAAPSVCAPDTLMTSER